MVDERIAALFGTWEDTMIRACLSGTMGRILVDNAESPGAAQAVLGDFCFFAGRADAAFAALAAAPIITPQNEAWAGAIEAAWGSGVRRGERHALKKGADGFDREKLGALAKRADGGYVFRSFDREIAGMALEQDWSRDFLALFDGIDDYLARGLGVAALYRGELVAGASSYALFPGGIEIEITTREDFRKRGLATSCAARLILRCLERGLYPGWDAANRISLHLAERLGYRFAGSYPVYVRQ